MVKIHGLCQKELKLAAILTFVSKSFMISFKPKNHDFLPLEKYPLYCIFTHTCYPHCTEE